MNDDDEDRGNVIRFPSAEEIRASKEKDQPKAHTGPVTLSKENVFRLIKALSIIHMATTYRARNNESCKENIRFANFPCKLNCACYVNIVSAMGLESFFGGETRLEAEALVDAEHEMIKAIYTELYDEDADGPDSEE